MSRPARIALVLLVTPAALLPGREGSPSPLPGGVTDASGRTGFLAGPSGGTDAVDLVTGDVLWSAADARRPLLVHGERLYALAVDGDRLRLRGYDVTNRGERAFESEPLPLPAWAQPLDAPGRSLSVGCRAEKGELVLTWDARQPRDSRQAAGTLRVDLRSGAVRPGPAEPAPPDPARQLARELDMLAVRWQGVVGKEFKVLVLEQEQGRQRFVLRSWDLTTGEARPPRDLLTGRRLAVLPTVDGRFLCLRDASPSPDLKPESEEGRKAGWSIVAVATGELAARAPFEAGTQAVALIGPRVYYLVSGPIRGPIHRPFVHPRSLKAIDLKTGKTLWERPAEGKAVTPPVP